MIRTQRLILDSLCESDIEALVELQSNGCVREFLGGPLEASKIRQNFQFALKRGLSKTQWAVRSPTRDFMGVITLSEHHDKQDTEVSYEFLPKYWGQGYAQESLLAVLALAMNELKLRRVVAETQVRNLKSIRLLEKIQMSPLRNVQRFGEQQVIYSTQLDYGII